MSKNNILGFEQGICQGTVYLSFEQGISQGTVYLSF